MDAQGEAGRDQALAIAASAEKVAIAATAENEGSCVMDADDVSVINVSVTDEGIEFLIHSQAETRKGISVAHSYYVEFAGETFGSRAQDLMTEIRDLAEDVHFGWKRAPKEDNE
jgi:hypothetical protein